MKISVSLKISLNSGAALILFTGSFFGLVLIAAHYESIERLFTTALAGLASAFAGFLVKRNANNKIRLEAEKNGILGGDDKADPMR